VSGSVNTFNHPLRSLATSNSIHVMAPRRRNGTKAVNDSRPSVDDFLSGLIVLPSYVVPIKVPVKGGKPYRMGPDSDFAPPPVQPRILQTHEIPRVKVWTEESYAQKYEIPRGFEREYVKERACDRDVMKVVAYCYHAENPFVFVQLAMKDGEEGLTVQEAVQAFHSLLASNLFPKVYSNFTAKMLRALHDS
ncbi:hypothetical protein PRIPAC_96858, partial [Pristionchus pacificus]|uniref:Uncharacterized protein n=1 Tax=Pristionchus pacificus TaxID=54126 RepID=A0A2A6CUC0_PRIPA